MTKSDAIDDGQNNVVTDLGFAWRGDVTILKGRFAGRDVQPVSVKAIDQAIGDEVARSFEAGTRDLMKVAVRNVSRVRS